MIGKPDKNAWTINENKKNIVTNVRLNNENTNRTHENNNAKYYELKIPTIIVSRK